MNENQPGSIDAVREERFVETDEDAFVFLSREESDRIRDKARLAQETRKPEREKTVAQ